jgi:hypothetical protein
MFSLQSKESPHNGTWQYQRFFAKQAYPTEKTRKPVKIDFNKRSFAFP